MEFELLKKKKIQINNRQLKKRQNVLEADWFV